MPQTGYQLEQPVSTEVLMRQGNTLNLVASPEVRFALGLLGSTALIRFSTDENLPGGEELRTFRSWENDLPDYDSGQEQWYSWKHEVVMHTGGHGEESKYIPVNFANKPYVIEDGSMKTVENFGVEDLVLPGFVRAMFISAQQASTLTSHDRYAVGRATDVRLLLTQKNRRGIDRMERELVSNEHVLETMIGRGYDSLILGVHPNSWIGKTFELFGKELGDPNQYQTPMLKTSAINRAHRA